MKPDLIMPLIETLQLEQRLESYLPEVCIILVLEFSVLLYTTFAPLFDLVEVAGSMVSRGYFGVAAESTIPPTNGFICLCKNLKCHLLEL